MFLLGFGMALIFGIKRTSEGAEYILAVLQAELDKLNEITTP